MERLELLPGVMLTAVQTDKFKSGSLSIHFLRPLSDNEAALNAMLPSVLLRGTVNHPDMRALSAALEDCYGAEIVGSVRKKGEVQAVGLYADFIDDRLADGEEIARRVVDLTAEIFLHPRMEDGSFVSDYVLQEKENLINAIRGRINSKRAYAASQTIRAMFKGEAYAVDRLGEEADAAAITPQLLTKHYAMWLSQSNIEICYIGSLPAATIATLLRRAFASIPRAKMTAADTALSVVKHDVQEIREALDVTQGKLCLGFRTDCTGRDPAWTAMVVFCTVYGSGVTSKLFCNVREKQSLCYYASASVDRFKGSVLVSSGIDFAQYETAKAAILREWKACCDGVISDAELASAKSQLVSAIRAQSDSPLQMDELYLGQAILGVWRDAEERIAAVRAVTAEDVAAAAKRLTLDTVYFLEGAKK